MPMVIKLWFFCHFSDDAENQYVWYTLIYICLNLDLEFYVICMLGVINKCTSILCDTQVLLSQVPGTAKGGGSKDHGARAVLIVRKLYTLD